LWRSSSGATYLGFRFSQTLIKPYPFSITASEEQLNFNYNLSKAWRVVENAIGHLKARFRLIGKGLDSHYQNNNAVILACCILHNILNEHNSAINETWQQAASDLHAHTQIGLICLQILASLLKK